MKTFMHNGKECMAVAIAFNKETENWRDKYEGILFNFVKQGIIELPNIYHRNDDSLIEDVAVMAPDIRKSPHLYYLKGVLGFYITVDKLESLKRYSVGNFKHGAAFRGENEEVDKIFSELERTNVARSEPA